MVNDKAARAAENISESSERGSKCSRGGAEGIAGVFEKLKREVLAIAESRGG
jgi:hypothetical protein